MTLFEISTIVQGDQFYILLHEGALKGGGISHTFTSLNGHKIANKKAITDENNGLLWRVVPFGAHWNDQFT